MKFSVTIFCLKNARYYEKTRKTQKKKMKMKENNKKILGILFIKIFCNHFELCRTVEIYFQKRMKSHTQSSIRHPCQVWVHISRVFYLCPLLIMVVIWVFRQGVFLYMVQKSSPNITYWFTFHRAYYDNRARRSCSSWQLGLAAVTQIGGWYVGRSGLQHGGNMILLILFYCFYYLSINI